MMFGAYHFRALYLRAYFFTGSSGGSTPVTNHAEWIIRARRRLRR